jgi:polyhydroxyalkanoate synthesis regulator phasin
MSAAKAEEFRLGDVLLASFQVGLGALSLAAGAMKKAAQEMRRTAAIEQAKTGVRCLREKGQEQQEQLKRFADKTSASLLERLDLARRSELGELRSRIAELEQRLSAVCAERDQAA